MFGGLDLLLDLPHINARYRVSPIEYTCDLLECGALRLDVKEEDEDELEKVPDLSAMTRVSPITLNQGREGRVPNIQYRTA